MFDIKIFFNQHVSVKDQKVIITLPEDKSEKHQILQILLKLSFFRKIFSFQPGLMEIVIKNPYSEDEFIPDLYSYLSVLFGNKELELKDVGAFQSIDDYLNEGLESEFAKKTIQDLEKYPVLYTHDYQVYQDGMFPKSSWEYQNQIKSDVNRQVQAHVLYKGTYDLILPWKSQTCNWIKVYFDDQVYESFYFGNNNDFVYFKTGYNLDPVGKKISYKVYPENLNGYHVKLIKFEKQYSQRKKKYIYKKISLKKICKR